MTAKKPYKSLAASVKLPYKPTIPIKKIRAAVRAALETCGDCSYARQNEAALICYRFPPTPVVIDNKAQNMRCAVQPNERACGEFKR